MDYRGDVPESVLFHILIFLPVVSLLRFKTVCKTWCSMIESSSFIRQHLNHNSGENNLIVQNWGNQVFILSGSKHEFCVKLNLEGIDPYFRIVGSCNGVICLGSRDSYGCWRLSLWNPAIKQLRKLPESRCFSSCETTVSYGVALVFDIKADGYKIVSISVDNHGRTLNEGLVQVYSMRTDSWQTIHEGYDFPIGWIRYIDAECNNEMCLWIGSSVENGMVIFYFDLANGAYGTVPLPNDRKGGPQCALTFVRDKVTYMEWNVGGRCRCYEIWRMDKFGVTESWNKLYKLEDAIMPRRIACLLYLSKDEDFFLVHKKVRNSIELYACYFATGEVKKLDVRNSLKFKNYVESMVSVKSNVEAS